MYRNNITRAIFSIAITFSAILSYAQEKSYPEIDSALQQINYKLQKEGKFKDAVAFNVGMITFSDRKKYPKGVGWAYYNIGNLLSTQSQYDESLKYLAMAEKELSKTTDFFLSSRLMVDIGKVNHFLGLYNIALGYYNKAIVLAEKVADITKRRNVLNYAYGCKADNFEQLKQLDSLYYYFRKAYEINPSPVTAGNIAGYFMNYKKKQMDSAKYYLDAGLKEFNTGAYDLFQKIVIIERYGNYYNIGKDYEKALDYYFRALEMAQQIQKQNVIRRLYQSIYKTYDTLKNKQKAAMYQLKYSRLNDSLSLLDKRALNLSISKLLEEKEIDNEKEKAALSSSNYRLMGILCLSVVVLIITGYIFYRKKKKEREWLIQSQEITIAQNESERKTLENKISDAFDEVLQLAKTNDPAFLARFREVYPEFCKRLLDLCPGLLTSELTFCAYLKLNLSAKEISNYTFVTIKAVQGRKNRIRKKLHIASEDDLYIWINKI